VNVEVVDTLRRSMDSISEPLYGKSRYLHDYCNELQLTLREKTAPHRTIFLTARAYDDAVAFRLHLPRQTGLEEVALKEEKTYINLQAGTAYALPLKNFRTHYENNYSIVKTGSLDPKTLIGLPLLMHLNSGPWVAITEADLENYPGMYVSAVEGAQHILVSRLAPLFSDTTLCVRLDTPHDLPWRVFMIADHPGKLIESNAILNLSDPCRIENPAWVHPGKVAWPWWSDRTVDGRNFEGGMNTPTMKYYIDFAADAGLEYLLIDALWYGKHNTPDEDITTTIPGIDLPHIIQYARERNVGILLWLYWECARDQMDKAFPLYEQWGIKGVKIDYMNRDDQEMVNFYQRVTEKAAQHHLLVDFHGAYKPTGLRRAYPNLITREGVLGLEWNKWSERCDPEHHLILPYTRMLAGPMDFTPGAFAVAARETFIARIKQPMSPGTRAHQLAMYVVYESPLQMVVDHPASYFGQTGFDFLKAVPTVWDETKFIEGEVGDYIALARRNGEEWYLGCMSDWTPRDLQISLSFLGDGVYMAQIYADDADRDPSRVKAILKEVTAQDSLNIHLAPGGGCAVRFVPTWKP
jgi:alpha-glucosidase